MSKCRECNISVKSGEERKCVWHPSSVFCMKCIEECNDCGKIYCMKCVYLMSHCKICPSKSCCSETYTRCEECDKQMCQNHTHTSCEFCDVEQMCGECFESDHTVCREKQKSLGGTASILFIETDETPNSILMMGKTEYDQFLNELTDKVHIKYPDVKHGDVITIIPEEKRSRNDGTHIYNAIDGKVIDLSVHLGIYGSVPPLFRVGKDRFHPKYWEGSIQCNNYFWVDVDESIAAHKTIRKNDDGFYTGVVTLGRKKYSFILANMSKHTIKFPSLVGLIAGYWDNSFSHKDDEIQNKYKDYLIVHADFHL